MQSIARTIAAAGVAAVCLSCADRSTGINRSGLARLPIAPVFMEGASGGPHLEIARVRGVLRRRGALDSAVTEADVRGDSAILDFPRVIVTGDSSTYELTIKAYDPADILIFKGAEVLRIRPGDNAPAAPVLHYAAPDASVASIDVVLGAQPALELDLDWAGALATDFSCLNRVPSPTATVQQQLTIAGRTADNKPVSNVRVGWTSRDTSVVTVSDAGVIRARCSNRSAWIVARTYLGVVDSVRVDVTAPPFTLLMEPESADVPRGDSLQLAAVVVDENGNAITTTGISWFSSDSSRATVSASGVVRGVSSGRVVVTAASGTRTTVAVIQVVPALADSVLVQPVVDTLAVGQSRAFSAAAFDATRAPIPDAVDFEWGTSNAAIARVSSAGVVTGVASGDALIFVSSNGHRDTSTVHVRVATTGQVSGVIRDAATGGFVSGASVSGQGTAAATDVSGRFVSSPLTPPASMQVSRTGYVSFDYYNVPVQLGQVTDVGELPMAPVGAGGTGTMSGIVVNALNDAPVPNAIVKIFPGVNPPSADPGSGSTLPAAIAETTTDAQGTFTLTNIAPGTYTYAMVATNFAVTRRVVAAVSGQTTTVRVALSPTILESTNGLRVVLSWGDCLGGASNGVPCDLDAHVTGPTFDAEQSRFHVAYFNERYVAELDTVAVLDNDATTGLGPETITLRPTTTGVFKYYVHNYTDGADTTNGRLASSAQARVDVYRGTNLVATFFPPPGQSGTVWAVFQYDGSTITPLGRLLQMEDMQTLPGTFLRAADPIRDEQRAILAAWNRPKN